ncbi:OLC1v1000089C1 [Oldenlandia corymbosa var. corymbosa]|uniref:OLC1v1000089C1 n=1 Tax=Oldenlandia corymbosa var. corymbosa TaxID=529605 RepID=A0AAV1D464_OLDCO|nr:OLC1v1000089C1 [Oldenlandia corymbosa var. corymbosa]
MDNSKLPAPFDSHHSWYISTLSSLSSPEGISPTHLYTYNHVISGFSAALTPSHLEKLEKMPVGAGTIDRGLSARVTFGDGDLQVTGKSIYPENLLVDRVPIYFGNGNRSKEICGDQTLDPNEVKGQYVFCDFDDQFAVFGQVAEVFGAGAAGAIVSTDSAIFLKRSDFNVPFVAISPSDGDSVKKYLTQSGNTTLSVKYQVTLLGTKPAPQVADFSSRGPVWHAPWTLKPDILAPGVDILAAWAPNRGTAEIGDDYLLTDYTLLSGTSMASPHIVGIAALLKSVHKDWSPAMIRSAMMTTADIHDNTNNTIIDIITGVAGTPLDYGAGHVNPNKAMDPGLVYDIQVEDYINYMCALNYTSEQLHTVTRRSNVSCENANLDLNYPSFIVILNHTKTASYTFKRELTNVVDANCSYHAVLEAPKGMKASVQPSTIQFAGKLSKSTFELTVEIDMGAIPQSDSIVNYGYLTWYEDNGIHTVRSPIVSATGAGP